MFLPHLSALCTAVYVPILSALCTVVCLCHIYQLSVQLCIRAKFISFGTAVSVCQCLPALATAGANTYQLPGQVDICNNIYQLSVQPYTSANMSAQGTACEGQYTCLLLFRFCNIPRKQSDPSSTNSWTDKTSTKLL
jgi:hypothetical protein